MAELTMSESKGSHMFWGILFVSLGFVLLVNYMFGLQLPVFRILFSLAIIYLGVKMLFGTFDLRIGKVATSNEAIFSSSQFTLDLSDWDSDTDLNRKKNEYNTVFGEGRLDLTDVDLTKGSVNLKINTVFGETKLYVKKGTPIRMRTSTVFGDASLPDGSKGVVGKFNYKTNNADTAESTLNIDADVVFGSLKVVEQ